MILLSLHGVCVLLVVSELKERVDCSLVSLGGVSSHQDRGHGRKSVPLPVDSKSPHEGSHSNWSAPA